MAKLLAPAGMLWVSWPKKSSGVATDLDDNVVRGIGLDSGLVDVKVCAVTDVWSGFKFVRRVKDRQNNTKESALNVAGRLAGKVEGVSFVESLNHSHPHGRARTR